MLMGAAIASSRTKNAASVPQQPAPSSTHAAPLGQDAVTLLKELADLRDNGILTDAEFESKKKQVLGI